MEEERREEEKRRRKKGRRKRRESKLKKGEISFRRVISHSLCSFSFSHSSSLFRTFRTIHCHLIHTESIISLLPLGSPLEPFNTKKLNPPTLHLLILFLSSFLSSPFFLFTFSKRKKTHLIYTVYGSLFNDEKERDEERKKERCHRSDRRIRARNRKCMSEKRRHKSPKRDDLLSVARIKR